MRLLQGQTTLENNKTIPELQLTNGSTLHMVLEPVKDIEVTIKLPLMPERKFTYSNNITPLKVLQHLKNEGILFRPTKDYLLLHGEQELPQELPLHFYNVDRVIQIKRTKIGLYIIDEYNDRLYITVNSTTDTILDVKEKITGTWGRTKEYGKLDQMKIYIQNDEAFNLLEDDCLIKKAGAEDNSKLYMIYYGWDSGKSAIKFFIGELTRCGKKVKRLDQTLDIAGGDGAKGRTAVSLALRIQEQYDIPAHGIRILGFDENDQFYTDYSTVPSLRKKHKIPHFKLHDLVSNYNKFIIVLPNASEIATSLIHLHLQKRPSQHVMSYEIIDDSLIDV